MFATDTKISIAELEEATGIRDRKLRRLKLVASKEWSCELFAADAVNYSNLATLIEKAGDDPRRQNALEETFKVKKERADAYVNLWKNKIAENPNLARKHGKKTKLSEQFKKENWKLWELSLENESLQGWQTRSGHQNRKEGDGCYRCSRRLDRRSCRLGLFWKIP